MTKVLALITTYNRPSKLLRLLGQFGDEFTCLAGILDIYIADDNPNSDLYKSVCAINSPLTIKYHKNVANLGQGPNLVHAIRANHGKNYDYLWCPGDDDLIVPDSFIELMYKIILNQPSAAVLEFRQGNDLKAGTYFAPDVDKIFEIDLALEHISRFGKGSSTIFLYPDYQFLSYVDSCMAQCMYQDKALAAHGFFLGLQSSNFLLIHSRLTAYGDSGYGKLRYSTRVFSNLFLTIKQTMYYTYGDSPPISYEMIRSVIGRESPLWWWFWGVRAHLHPSSEIKYSNYKFLCELCFGWFIAIWYEKVLKTFQPS